MNTHFTLSAIVLLGLFGAPLPAERRPGASSPDGGAIEASSLFDDVNLASFDPPQEGVRLGFRTGRDGDSDQGVGMSGWLGWPVCSPPNDSGAETWGAPHGGQHWDDARIRDWQPIPPGDVGWDDLTPDRLARLTFAASTTNFYWMTATLRSRSE